MNLGKTACLALTAVVAASTVHAAPALGVGDCVGPKVISVEQLPGNRAVFHGTPALLLAVPGGRSTGQSILPGETYVVFEAERGFLHLKASGNSGSMARDAVAGWVSAASVSYFWGPHNCL